MNVVIDFSARAGMAAPLQGSGAARLGEARIAPIAAHAAAIVFDDPAGPAARRRVSARIGGEPVARPSVGASLELRSGGARHVILVGHGARALLAAPTLLELDGRPVAATDPRWLEAPVVDPADLGEGLSDGGRLRLAKLLLTTGAACFGRAAAPGFARTARAALDSLRATPVAAASWCPIGRAGGVASYRLPATADSDRIGELVVLSAGGVARLGGCGALVELTDGRRLLHLHIPRALPQDSVIVGFGERMVQLEAPGGTAVARPLAGWLGRRSPETRRWVEPIIAAAAARDPAAAALSREVRHAASPAPALTIAHLSATPQGVLAAFELDDPHQLVAAVRFERGGPDDAVEIDARGAPDRSRRAVYAGAPRRALDDVCRVRLVHRSGRIRTVHEGPLGPFDGVAPTGFAEADDAAAVAVLLRARRNVERRDPRAATARFGPDAGRVTLSVVAGVGADLDLIRARAAMVRAEPGARDVELVYHVAAGPAAPAARAAIAQAAAVFGLPHALVTAAPDSDATDRLLAALGTARGAALLVLGAEVLPERTGWLARWRRGLGARRILGGTLLDHDGAVLDAGGRIRTGKDGATAIERRGRGLPAALLPRAATAPTALVTAQCVGLSRAGAESLAWLPRRGPDPDLLLTEAALRLAAGGPAARTHLTVRFVRYGAQPVDALGAAVDEAALCDLVKGSFSPTREEDAPCPL